MSSAFPSAMLVVVGFLLGLACHAAAETVIPAGKARVKETGGAMQNDGWNLWSNGALGEWFNAEADGEVTFSVDASGTPCDNVFPQARWVLRTDTGECVIGEPFAVDSETFKTYTVKVPVKKGRFALQIEFLNDAQAHNQDRNLLLKQLRLSGASLLEKAPAPGELTARQNQKAIAEADQNIPKLRMGTLTVITEPNAKVKVTQLKHEFLFGTAIAHQIWSDRTPADVREKYQQILKENFNHAVHENALKWYHTQNKAGDPNWKDADDVLAWCEQNGIQMRGHCVFWGIEQYVQQWVKDLDDQALRATLEKRAREVAARYKGRISEFDLNNEMIHGNYYSKRFGEEITKDMFDWVKASNPDTILYVNDYSILTGNDGPRYIAHIKKLLAMGAPIGGIGLQGHFGKSVDGIKVKRTLDELAQFKLPIKITEYDVDVADEQVKTDSLETLYKVCFAHPAVEGLLMWGFWEGAHWRPKAALWKKDFSPTPAAEAYRRLLFKDWWTTYEGQADAMGRCELRAFFGKHAVEANDKRVEVELKKADGKAEITVK